MDTGTGAATTISIMHSQ